VCEEKESMELAKLDVFWEDNGSIVGGKGGVVTGGGDGDAELEREKEEWEWEKEVVGTLESLKTVQVADG
jgi:nuclear pore complex protein Nup107